MKRRGNYGNADGNTGSVPDTPTQMLRHLQKFLEQKRMYESTYSGTLSLNQRDDSRSVGACERHRCNCDDYIW